MKKEGTGKPQNPDIVLDADVRMRELHFERAPEPEVRFQGNTRRNSVWGSRRENLPDEVQEGVIYREARVRLRIATEVVVSNTDVWNNSDKERIQINPERIQINPEDTDKPGVFRTKDRRAKTQE